MISFLIAVLAGIMAGLVVYRMLNEKIPSPSAAARAREPKKVPVRKSLKELWRSRYGDEEQNAKANKQRLDQLAAFIEKILPISSEAIANSTTQLTYSGIKMSASIFWALQVLFTFIGLVAGAYIATSSNASLFQVLLVMLLFGLLGSQVMNLYVWNHRKKWRMALEKQLPNSLDLILVVVCAGSTLEAAIKIVAETQKGELPDAFKDVVAETRYGSLMDSLAEFAKRSGSSSLQIFTGTLQQGLATGASLVDILQMQAAALRRKRRMMLEEKANKLPTKLLFPMLAFCFPVMMIIILVPMLVSIVSSLGTMFSS